jgi:hypothetical protein
MKEGSNVTNSVPQMPETPMPTLENAPGEVVNTQTTEAVSTTNQASLGAVEQNLSQTEGTPANQSGSAPENAAMPKQEDLTPAENPNGEKVTPATNEASAGAVKENMAAQEPGMKKEQSLTSIGEQRYQKMAAGIKEAKGKLGSLFKNGATKIGRFLKNAAFGALAAPEAIGRGVDRAGEKVQDASDWMNKQSDAFDKWQDDKAEAIEAFTLRAIVETQHFILTKKKQVEDAAREKALLVAMIAELYIDQKVESFNRAKESFVSGYRNTIDYGRNAIIAANVKRQEAAKWYKTTIHSLKIRFWERKADKNMAKFEKAQKKIEGLKKLSAMEEQFKAEAAKSTEAPKAEAAPETTNQPQAEAAPVTNNETPAVLNTETPKEEISEPTETIAAENTANSEVKNETPVIPFNTPINTAEGNVPEMPPAKPAEAPQGDITTNATAA